MGNRRTYITLAEALRSKDVDDESREVFADVVTEALTGRPGFDADRFRAHALGTFGNEKWAYNRATQTGGYIPAPRVDPLAARRSFVNLAESVKNMPVSDEAKADLVLAITGQLNGSEGFDGARFSAHALGTYGDAKWAYNRANGGPVLSDADTAVL